MRLLTGCLVGMVMSAHTLALDLSSLSNKDAVGGLKDTVTDYDSQPRKATGFNFQEPEPIALLSTLRRALLFYLQEPEEYRRVQQTAMRTRYLWSDSVLHYEQMYRDALGLNAGP